MKKLITISTMLLVLFTIILIFDYAHLQFYLDNLSSSLCNEQIKYQNFVKHYSNQFLWNKWAPETPEPIYANFAQKKINSIRPNCTTESGFSLNLVNYYNPSWDSKIFMVYDHLQSWQKINSKLIKAYIKQKNEIIDVKKYIPDFTSDCKKIELAKFQYNLLIENAKNIKNERSPSSKKSAKKAQELSLNLISISKQEYSRLEKNVNDFGNKWNGFFKTSRALNLCSSIF